MQQVLRRFIPATLVSLTATFTLLASPIQWRINDPGTVTELLNNGGKLVADYGSFSVVETTGGDIPENAERLPPAQLIHLHAGAIDTSLPATQARRLAVESFSGKRLHLVQWSGPVKPEWADELTAAGLEIVDYVPENAYLVYGDSAAISSMQRKLAGKAHVRWEGAYRAADKIHPDASPNAGKHAASRRDPDQYAIQLVLDPAANADTLGLIDALKLAPPRQKREFGHYVNLVVRLPADTIAALAEQPDVVSIWPYDTPHKMDERQGMIVSGNLSGNNPSGAGYLAWLASKGFTQTQFDNSGLVVDVTDSGIDNGTTNANHFALFRTGTTSNVSRVRYNRLEGTANTGSTLQGCDGHGNLNAHIISGYVSLTNFPHTDSSGYRFGLGIAPFVKVGSSVIFDPSNFTDPTYADLASRAYRDGARISGNSWGADTAGGYDVDAQTYDSLVRDSQPAGSAVANSGNQQLTFVFAAGNAGSGAQTVGSPGTAKNVITVGAAENVHSHATANGGNNTAGNDGCTTPDTEANSANDMATFSSRGPCADGRKKPDIVAPGTHVTGGVGQNVRTMSGLGTALSCFSGEGVCGLPGGGTVGSTNNFFPLGQRWYTTSSGTSHSTPAVAGGAALVYQWFLNTYTNAPSPAMIKAFLMNAARYMNGTGANDALFSNSQGMGMMNLGTAFDGTSRILRDQLGSDKFTASGQSRTISGTATDTNKPVRITLAWTDAPGSTVGNAYKNDLNLTVTANGNTYRGNVFSGANSTTGGSSDTRNNTECVFLPAGVSGAIVITVDAANINSDGVPNEAPSIDQDYALVVYNVSEVQAPVISLEGAAIVAESCGIGNGAADPDEAVTISVVLRNVGTASTTNVIATLLATNGITSPSSAQAYGALAAGGSAVTNTFSFTASGSCGDTITARFRITDGTNILSTLSQNYVLGSQLLSSFTNSNTSLITIPDSGTATPYPSTINVSGVGNTLAKVAVQISGWSHTYPADVNVLLVGPGGQGVVLIAEAGAGNAISGVNVTIDDDAAGYLPTDSIITSGTYKPTDAGNLGFDAPAPVGPYGADLSTFAGTNPNGVWSLYVIDQYTGDAGAFGGGWKLSLTTGEPLCCASNQPPILQTIGSKSAFVSNGIMFSVSAVDPYDGDPITLTASNLPFGATFGSTNGAGTFTWASAEPVGVYTSVFTAADKDGIDSETVVFTISEVPTYDTNCAMIISEYIEGSSNNKALEFYNPGPGAVDFTAGNYLVQLYVNGSASVGTTIKLSGTIPENGVFVLANSSSAAGILSVANQTTNTLTYNGDDAVVLRAGGATGTVVDSIGQVGVDPGSEWGTGLTSTADNTLRRKASVITGDTTTTNAFDPSIEWDGFATDTFTGLGSHTNLCSGGGAPTQSPPILLGIGNRSTAVSNSLVFGVIAVGTDGDAVTLTASNLPAGATFGATNEVGTFSWPNAGPVGVYTSSFYASDNDGTASETIIITVFTATEGGSESFSNLNASASTYGSGSYVGDNGISWNYRGARKPDTNYFIDGQTIGFGSSSSNPRDLTSETIAGGVGTLSVKYRKYFTGTGSRSFDVYVNTQLVGQVADANVTNATTLSIPDINISGDVVITIQSTGASQLILDTLTWSSYAGVVVNPDSDFDGLLDQWEIDNFGSLTNANGTTDSDGDFVSDLNEYLSGTQPTNDASYLRVVNNTVSSGNGFVVTWPGVIGKSYALSRSTNLLEYIYSVIASNLIGVEPVNVYTDSAPVGASSLYRIELE